MGFWSGAIIIVSMLIGALVINNYLEKNQMAACLKNNTIESCYEFLN